MAQITLNTTGVASNGSLVLQSNGTTAAVIIDTSQNVGVGVTPGAWQTGANLKALQVGVGAAFFSDTNSAYLSQNVFQDSAGTSKYINTNFASKYQQSSSVHSWFTAASGTAGNAITFTQAMTLTAAGDLGIGTSSPVSRLDVRAAAGELGRFAISNSGVGYLLVGGGASTTEGLRLSYDNSDGSSNINNFFNAALKFSTNNTERARIDSSGNLLVGSSSTIGTGGVFQVTSSTDTSLFKCTSSTTYAAIVSNVENTAARLMAFQYGSGGSPTNVGTITTNGTVVVYGGTSDYRLKTVIGAVTGHGERIDALEPVEYTWNSNGSHTRGFLAHKFQEVYADSVAGTKDAVDAKGNPEYQSMQAGSSEVIADLVAEIQSLRKRLAAAGI
jgi:hypothetical protein